MNQSFQMSTIPPVLASQKINLSQITNRAFQSPVMMSNGSPMIPVHPILQQIQTLNGLYQTNSLVVQQTPKPPTVDLTEQEEIGKMKDDGLEESVSTEVFSKYLHREIVPGCMPHPGDIVEAGPLAELLPPDPTYPVVEGVTSDIVATGKLSSLQLEGVLYACQRHQMILTNGQRAGFFIGDAAGVGKGRQIAGIILDNFSRKRTKHIWFTISSDLIVDARRDLTDLGCHIRVIDGCQELDKETRVLGLPADFKEGVVFSTYATLVSSVQRGGVFSTSKHSRIQQLVNWCGGDNFDGCLIFDECHKAKNFVPGKEQNSTKVALSVATIQRHAPEQSKVITQQPNTEWYTDELRVAKRERRKAERQMRKTKLEVHKHIYKEHCSRTSKLLFKCKMDYYSNKISVVGHDQKKLLKLTNGLMGNTNQAFMERLGLWGEGSPFKTFEGFLDTVHKKGLGMAEMLAMEMKMSGMYISRGLSYKQAEFVTIEAPLTTEQKKIYDVAAKVWNELWKALTSASRRCQSSNQRLWVQYWSSHQRFFKQLCMGMKVPTIVKETKESLEAGCCVVIGLQTTGEASLDSELTKKGSLTGFMSLCREILTRFINQYFPVMIETKIAGVDPIQEDEWSKTAKGMLLGFAEQISLPDSPLDEIIDKLGGPSCVSEMTGRKGRIVRHRPTDTPKYEQRSADIDAYGGVDSLNVQERNQFMEGKKLVAIISDAASTGISLHADKRVANQCRRVHLTVELPWSADKAVQQLGRSHRSNQSRSKKLVPGIDLHEITEKYNFEQFLPLVQESLVLMGLADIENIKLGVALKDSDAGDVSKFLNRILGLSVEKQNLMFNYFTEVLKLTIQNARKEGRYNEGMLDITASSVEMIGEPKEIFSELNKSHTKTRLIELNIDRGMSWDMAVTRLESHTGPHDGFYISKRDMWGRKLCILATQKETSSHLFRISRPNTGLSMFEEEKAELMHKYVPLAKDKAEKLWKELYSQSKDQCIHGKSCKHSKTCKVGSRCYRMHLLCGSIVSHMTLLEATLNKFAVKLNLSKSEATIRVVRVKLNNGERVVGVRYPEVLVRQVEKVLTEQNRIQAHMIAQDDQLKLSHYFSNQSSPVRSSSQPSGLNKTPSSQPDISSSPSLATGIRIKTEPGLDVSQSPSTKEKLSDRISQRFFTEPITPVCLKSQRKAFRPPVTIMSFFKPSVTTSLSGSLDKSKNSCLEKTNISESQGKSNGIGKNTNIIDSKKDKSNDHLNNKMPKEKYCVLVYTSIGEGEIRNHHQYQDLPEIYHRLKESKFDLEESIDSYGTKKTEEKLAELCKTEEIRDDDSTSVSRVTILVGGCDSCKNVGCEGKDTKKETKGKKRKSSTPVVPSSKRRKQSSIMNSFAKSACKKEESIQKEKTCPICQKKFDLGTSNDEINEHIDNCLIE
ncbi:Protein strawberry notch homolog 2,Protein FORGETTER 1,Protein strawberry notch,Protein strawberry notch homolog 1 [Mytilus edulis]|uniref:Protein strawberry notch homolog 2,Protein FORGETTER 1,Protein strawberry notch,Protein strawberry notch homolog 1 n=1 Tax=Mytilus edulis TaxID=6550 RepID=A0A8S3T3M4_MYTED|nr:Protein strawberry notch homolog 2,Protein FORGETTER 1,Protein strawberry notch,Protein strawberry notch homolog 1 [Mytilus edulis]